MPILLFPLGGPSRVAQVIPPTPDVTPTISTIPGLGLLGRRPRRGLQIGDMIAEANRIEDEETFILLM